VRYRKLCMTGVAAGVLTASVVAPVAAAPAPPAAAPSTIAVIGDIPYGAAKLAEFPTDIDKINADPDVSLVAHLGDIKNGSSVCSDSYFATIRADFDRFDDPLVYTPGDNEWTDCHRANNGGYVPTERLGKVRQVFFPVAGRTLGVNARQVVTEAADPAYASYVENTMWTQSNVVFSAVNVPGSNNDLVPWFGTTPLSAAQQNEYSGRLAADLEWINAAFNTAGQTGAAGVAILMQADMWDTSALAPGGDGLTGFDPIVQRIGTLAHHFGKPVLILQGDSHSYRVDHPFTSTDPLYGIHPLAPDNLEAPNVTRVVVDGSANAADYLKLTVDPAAPGVFNWTRVYY
jgi:Calcineurin-like phosphoesterase